MIRCKFTIKIMKTMMSVNSPLSGFLNRLSMATSRRQTVNLRMRR